MPGNSSAPVIVMPAGGVIDVSALDMAITSAAVNRRGHGTTKLSPPLGLAGEPGGSAAIGPDRNSGPGMTPSERLMPTERSWDRRTGHEADSAAARSRRVHDRLARRRRERPHEAVNGLLVTAALCRARDTSVLYGNGAQPMLRIAAGADVDCGDAHRAPMPAMPAR